MRSDHSIFQVNDVTLPYCPYSTRVVAINAHDVINRLAIDRQCPRNQPNPIKPVNALGNGCEPQKAIGGLRDGRHRRRAERLPGPHDLCMYWVSRRFGSRAWSGATLNNRYKREPHNTADSDQTAIVNDKPLAKLRHENPNLRTAGVHDFMPSSFRKPSSTTRIVCDLSCRRRWQERAVPLPFLHRLRSTPPTYLG